MTKHCILLFLAGLLPVLLPAQLSGRMETDRPDQTECPFITKKGWLQAEIGFNLEKDDRLTTLVHPTVLWKYGLSKRFEFRLITAASSAETGLLIPAGNEIQSGIQPIQLGGKLALWEEKGPLPKTSLIFHVAPAKLGSKPFHTDKWAPNFRFTMQHTLSAHCGLGYNIGAEWDGFDNKPAWIYTLSPGFTISKRWYAYAELFGAVKKGELPEHAVDGGFAFYISDNVKLDLSSGAAISGAATDWYSALGISIRLRTVKGK